MKSWLRIRWRAELLSATLTGIQMSVLKISNLSRRGCDAGAVQRYADGGATADSACAKILPRQVVQQMRMQMLPDTPAERLVVPVKRYESCEPRVDLRATYKNPYDPDDIDLWAEFTAPSGKVWKVWARRVELVILVDGQIRARRGGRPARRRKGARPGRNRRKQTAGDPGNRERSPRIRPACEEQPVLSSSTTGLPFTVSVSGKRRLRSVRPGPDHRGGAGRIVARGANFISFFHSPLETMGTGLGRYDENRAGRLDQIFDWCEKRDIQISWNIWFHSYISRPVG